MAETHPNAYRAEAAEKRAEAVRLNEEADHLEAQAEALDPTPKKVSKPKAEKPQAEKLPKGYKRDKNGKLRDSKGHYVKE